MPLLAALSGGAIMFVLLLLVAVYALSAYPLVRIANRTNDCGDIAWWAWVPVMNVILMCRIGRVNGWTALLLLCGALPFGALITLGYTVYLWVQIGRRFDRTGLAVLAAALPIIGAWIFAFAITPEYAA
jgi:Family of unknown function (DUF5684)